MEDAQSDGAPNGAAGSSGGDANEERRVFPPPRKLSDAQEVEVTRLYAETNTPIADIAGRFGIGESSVYRVAKRHGAALRGRVGRGSGEGSRDGAATATGAEQASADGTTGRGRGRRRSASSGQPAASAAPSPSSGSASSGRRGSGGGGRAASSPSTGRAAGRRGRASATRGEGERRRFRVVYAGVLVVEASGIREALASAESQGAREVTSVQRED